MKEGKHPIVPQEKEWKTVSQKAKAQGVQGEGLKQR